MNRKIAVVLTAMLTALSAEAGEPKHGLAIYDEPKYPPDWTHYDHVNPDAPKGGTLQLSASGTFDSFNPFIIKGSPAIGAGLLHLTLTAHSLDEPFTEYGLVAETMELAEDRSSIAFNLRPKAVFHDGEPIKPEDVIFSFDILRTEGTPLYRKYWANVTRAEKTGERQVTFFFSEQNNRELPLIMGQLPVLPKHYYDENEFDKTSLEPPLGSGLYQVDRFEPGRFISYKRVENHWADDLPVHKGRNNWARLEYEYYRDRDVMVEAFKAGHIDLFAENSAKRWATGYEGPMLDAGVIIKEEFPEGGSSRMQGYVFNTRREIFQDPRVREAIGYAFDFEWLNRNIFYGAYERINSYFYGSEEFNARELPNENELALLEQYREHLPPEVFTTVYEPPKTDGSGNPRRSLRAALQLLRDAGWSVQDGVLTHNETGRRMEFEYLYIEPSSERIAAPFARNLERLGIKMRLRRVDTSQYQERLNSFDFDMVTIPWGQSISPGNEQRDYWSCAAADFQGSRNYAGICNPAIDALIEHVIEADTREELVTATRSLDRALIWGHYVVPQFSSATTRIARWDIFSMPDELPPYRVDTSAWWIDTEKMASLGARKEAARSGGARAQTSN
ncbi:MAG: extracellular solute-binding protein [Geminicoccaceae bacterium]